MDLKRTEDIVGVTEAWLDDRVKRYDVRSIFLPAGETPKAVYAQWRKRPPSYLETCRLIQVDDVLTGSKAGLFARFFAEELPGFKVIPPVQEERGDLAFLGLGTNGHVAFHEPGIPMNFRFGDVDLEDDTAARLQLEPGTKGRTYGVGAFLDTKALLIVIKGESKRAVMEKFLKGDPSVPASGLLKHPDLTVVTDLK